MSGTTRAGLVVYSFATSLAAVNSYVISKTFVVEEYFGEAFCTFDGFFIASDFVVASVVVFVGYCVHFILLGYWWFSLVLNNILLFLQ